MNGYRARLVASAVVAVAVFAIMGLGYAFDWVWLARLDDWVLAPARRFGEAHPAWVTAWDVYCTVLGPNAFRLITLIVIVVALVRRNVRIAMFLLISVELSGLVTEVAKDLVDRPRPAGALVAAASSSFPSGHALGVMVAVSALMTVVVPVVGVAWRGWVITLGVVIVVTIGAGRVVLNVHHPSDVVAGWALGYVYFAVCLLLVPPSRPITQQDETPAMPGSGR